MPQTKCFSLSVHYVDPLFGLSITRFNSFIIEIVLTFIEIISHVSMKNAQFPTTELNWRNEKFMTT